MKRPYKTKRYFMAECECGWVVDGYERRKIERQRAKHQPNCPKSITRITSSVTKHWDPAAK